jgi:hypothetical protein
LDGAIASGMERGMRETLDQLDALVALLRWRGQQEVHGTKSLAPMSDQRPLLLALSEVPSCTAWVRNTPQKGTFVDHADLWLHARWHADHLFEFLNQKIGTGADTRINLSHADIGSTAPVPRTTASWPAAAGTPEITP